ncbi:sirohydrochlorin chelatase [Azohydromonas caseinilytica]|uniref:Cobalamin biosynthesis protein CbiX n=1 Tax=Azohydromonas caseinilytica TaxID=2728836 RepID=A0A848FDD0_9BURK|nr:CbiX/SirB N-terminal domain-containing protein [Azohydromonas caseinilytica]NML17464.1 cobalamin biosynthesis protein CbiX [Azohydromonas caseinilytica]
MNDAHSRGLLLFAHGARDPDWARPFEAVAQSVRAQRPGTPVALAYLEFMQPDMAQATAALVAAGCRRVEVLPLFLGAGGHVRKDLPQLLDGLRATHPGVHFELHPAVGELPTVVQAMAGAALSLLATKEANQP